MRLRALLRPSCVCALAASLLSARHADAATISVQAGGDFQAALNRAAPGDTILLAAGATFTGNFILPVKSGSTMITIRSSAPDTALPGATTRIDPGYAAVLPKIQSSNSLPALSTAPGAHHYTLMALEFPSTYQGYYIIVALGDGSSAQNTLASVPHDLVLDRVYVHGDVFYGQKCGVTLNSASTTVTNSYIAEIKGSGQDAQALAGTNGPGPFTITNNYLEAAGENVLFGGADPAIPNLVPSDITIRGNHLAKQLLWQMQPQWSVKNLLELKNAQRVVIDGNVLEYNWLAGQTGYAVVLTPRNQDGTAPWSVVQHVQFTNNLVRHVAAGINILGTDDERPSQTTTDVLVRNNLFEDVSQTWGGDGRFLLIGQGAQAVAVDHNTVLQTGTAVLYAYGAPMSGFSFTNNIVPDYSWAIMGGGASPGDGTISAYFPGGVFLKGVFAGSNPAVYPAGNYYPPSLSAVGFVDLAGGNYQLAPTSPYHNAATDGTDVGCNIALIPSAPGFSRSDPAVLLQNDATRQAMLWHAGTQTNSVQGWSSISSAGIAGWSVVAVADFNGDGMSDVVWQNDVTRQVTVWYMGGTDGSVLTGWSWLSAGGVPGWKVVAVADFNNDGHPDLVWQNDATRQVTVWYMGGPQSSTLVGWNWLSATGVPGWRIAAARDFDGDGHPDLLWQNDATRQATVWYMGGSQGTIMRTWAWVTPGGVPGWTIVGSADFDGDGRPDIIWQNDVTRQVTVWYMQGALGNAMGSWSWLSAAAMPGWTVVSR